MFGQLWSVWTFSGGLPVCYLIAAVYFFVFYWVYKFLLLKVYQKTTRFNEDLPLQSINLLRYGLFFHIFITLLMISNHRLLPSIEETDLGELSEWLHASESSSFFTKRFHSSAVQLYMFVVVCALLVWIVRDLFVEAITWLILRMIACCCRGKAKEARQMIVGDLHSRDLNETCNAC